MGVGNSGNDVFINSIAVPAPAAMALFGSAVALLGFRLARRQRRA